MGREIRRVPKGWGHPRDTDGKYRPMFDRTIEDALEDWRDFEDEDPECKPEPEYYRPAWTEPATCYQVYEDVTEGTPVSPIFETEEELLAWLIAQGHSEGGARRFIQDGWVPSMLIGGGRCAMNIDICDVLVAQDQTGLTIVDVR